MLIQICCKIANLVAVRERPAGEINTEVGSLPLDLVSPRELIRGGQLEKLILVLNGTAGKDLELGSLDILAIRHIQTLVAENAPLTTCEREGLIGRGVARFGDNSSAVIVRQSGQAGGVGFDGDYRIWCAVWVRKRVGGRGYSGGVSQ